MKGLTAFLLTFCSLITFSQTSIFTENCGIPATTTSVTTYTGWQNNGTLTFSGNADVRTTTASTGYTGASANGNVFITNTIGQNFVISNINTTNYLNLALSVGVFKSTTASNGSELKIEVSSDGTTYTALSFTMATGTGTAKWYLISPTGTIPSTSNLRLRFRNTSSTPQFRIDDINLVGDYSAPMPVELVSFSGDVLDDKIQLKWSTASEWNSKLFVVEKLMGDEWEAIGDIQAAGWSDSLSDYEFDDVLPTLGNNYYRLRQVDFDETSVYSNIILIKHRGSTIEDDTEYYNMLGEKVTELQTNTFYIKVTNGKAKKFLYIQ